ncbi:hypothetical protein [Streptomyces sp. GbtcB7]|uniref:hypothetical protein n=1 Tax=Streptomyces sp. GbtcB7 TaxID=2824752 RepID=UPI001C304BF9|nr:hypothetical protein [Streptomyces sp. GbtcB7]
MTQDWSIRLRVMATIDAIDDVKTELTSASTENPESVQISHIKTVENPSEFRLDLAQYAELVGTFTGVFFGGALVPRLVAALKRKKNRNLIIESPLGRVTLTSSTDLSEDQVRQKLKKLIGSI